MNELKEFLEYAGAHFVGVYREIFTGWKRPKSQSKSGLEAKLDDKDIIKSCRKISQKYDVKLLDVVEKYQTIEDYLKMQDEAYNHSAVICRVDNYFNAYKDINK